VLPLAHHFHFPFWECWCMLVSVCFHNLMTNAQRLQEPGPVAQSDCGSEGMGFDPYSVQSKVRLFSLSIFTDKIFLVVQSTPPSTGSLVSV
jgi:hypothetical protein